MTTTPFRVLIIIIATAAVISTVSALILPAILPAASTGLYDRLEIWIFTFSLAISVPLALIGAGFMLVGLWSIIVNANRMADRSADGVNPWGWKYALNPYNLVFFPEDLTEPGRKARQLLFRGIYIYLGGVLLCIPAFIFSEIAA